MQAFDRFLLLMVAALGVLLVFSYQDLIFQTELSQPCPFSLLERGLADFSPNRIRFLGLISLFLVAVYARGYFIVRATPEGLPRRFWWGFLGVLGLTMATMPFDSTDVSVYINLGWLQEHYRANPYLTAVVDIPHWTGDPMLRDHWIRYPAVYGPVFALLARGIALLGSGHYLITVLGFKLLGALCHVGITWLLWRIPLANRSDSTMAAYLYAFSPFILLQHVANAHNDTLMAFFTLLALFLLLQKRHALWVIPVFVLGILVKYLTLLLLPILMLWMGRVVGWRTTLVSALLGVLTVGLCCLPYAAGLSQIRYDVLADHANLLIGSFQALLVTQLFPLIYRMGYGTLAQWVGVSTGLKIVLWGSLLLLWGWSLFRVFRAQRFRFPQIPLVQMVWVMTVLVCVVSPKFYPWYLGMIFPLALLLPEESRLYRFVLYLATLMTLGVMGFGGTNPAFSVLLILVALIMTACRTPALLARLLRFSRSADKKLG